MSAYIPPHRRNKKKKSQQLTNQSNKNTVGSSFLPNDRWRKNIHHLQNENMDEDLNDKNLSEKFTRICCINLKRRQDRWKTFCSRMQGALGESSAFVEKVERFDAVDGAAIMAQRNDETGVNDVIENYENEFPKLQWDATKNALYDRHIKDPMTKFMTPGEVGCAMSHLRLWRQLENRNNKNDTMLILEDDAIFYANRAGMIRKNGPSNGSPTSTPNFVKAISLVWKALPSDWDILYLGFSDRGERNYICKDLEENPSYNRNDSAAGINIHIFRPTYGFHTHAYALTGSTASKLLSNLPVNGPLDVWLADNEWFGLNVYCTVVPKEGWNGQGASLISQRRHDTKSDIWQSGRGLK